MDIVENLRLWQSKFPVGSGYPTAAARDLIGESADTIERLRHDLLAASDKIATMSAQLSRVAEKAMLVELEKEGEQLWLPLSQVLDESDFSEGDIDCTVGISSWLAREKGLEVD